MQLNFFLTTAIAALVPVIIGIVWYNSKIFGTAFMQSIGMNEEKSKKGFNTPIILGLTYVFSFMIAFALSSVVIHQMGFFSMLQNHFKEPAVLDFFKTTMITYGGEFRTFKHGALHGGITGVFIALPIIAISAMIERRGFKYIAITAGYWILSLILMGGIICQFADMNSFG